MPEAQGNDLTSDTWEDFRYAKLSILHKENKIRYNRRETKKYYASHCRTYVLAWTHMSTKNLQNLFHQISSLRCTGSIQTYKARLSIQQRIRNIRFIRFKAYRTKKRGLPKSGLPKTGLLVLTVKFSMLCRRWWWYCCCCCFYSLLKFYGQSSQGVPSVEVTDVQIS